MKNHLQILKEMNFERIGHFFIKKNKFIVECDEKYLELEKMIYIHTIDNEIIRVGSSKNKLKRRMKSWERDVSKSLNGEKSSTPLWESKMWDNLLKDKIGILFGRKGTIVSTPVGEFNSYLSEESFLIGKFLPKMNRSKHR